MLISTRYFLLVLFLLGLVGVQVQGKAWHKKLAKKLKKATGLFGEKISDFKLNKKVKFHYEAWYDSERLKVNSDLTLWSDVDTVFFVHGYMSGTSSSLFKIPNSLLDKEDVQTVYVNWSKDSKTHYPGAVAMVPRIGATIAKFIMRQGLNNNRVHCVGHSLGAHICGRAGKFIKQETGTKLARITGLDPANPLFYKNKKKKRLHRNDATFVDVIHTDKVMGETYPIGHMDFYPNGGRQQPGCNASKLKKFTKKFNFKKLKGMSVKCAHTRAILLYEASIRSDRKFKSRWCGKKGAPKSMRQCKRKAKGKVHFANMGYFTKKVSKRGSYFLRTKSKYPYAKN